MFGAVDRSPVMSVPTWLAPVRDDASGHPPSGLDGPPVGDTGRGQHEWARLIGQHQRRVVLALVATGFAFAEAEELAQEAWARLIEKDRQGRLPELKLPGLAIVQARFLAWDQRRRRAVQGPSDPIPTDAAGEDLLVDHGPDPEQRLLTRQQMGRALQVVAAAPLPAQRLFHLMYGEPGATAADVSRELGLSVQRVRQILCELRKRVRAALEGDRP